MIEENVKISVIIPVYNAADLLPRAVDSVLIQDFPAYEVILVNDGSTDESAHVCDDFAQQEQRVRVIHKENGGVSSARNAGIEAARGEYVMFLDADDAICYGSLDSMYSRGCDFVLAGFEKIEAGARTSSYCPSGDCIYTGIDGICRFFDKVLPKQNTYILNSACFKLFRRSILVSRGIRFVEGLSFAEDKIFVMSFLEHVDKVRTVPAAVYSYFIRQSSLSSNMNSDAHAEEIYKLLACYAPLLERLEIRYARSARITALYHRDLVGRYVCRVLGILAVRKSALLTDENISDLYTYIDGDRKAGVFSIRLGQVPNMILYKIGKPGLTRRFYRLTSSVASIFRKKI